MIRKVTEKFVGWCQDETIAARLERTIVQGVIAVVAVGVTTGAWGAAAGVGVIMAILSPVQKAIGNKGVADEE